MSKIKLSTLSALAEMFREIRKSKKSNPPMTHPTKRECCGKCSDGYGSRLHVSHLERTHCLNTGCPCHSSAGKGECGKKNCDVKEEHTHPHCDECYLPEKGKEVLPHPSESLDELVRDLTKVGSIPKSEARRRIQALLSQARSEERGEIVKRIENICASWAAGEKEIETMKKFKALLSDLKNSLK